MSSARNLLAIAEKTQDNPQFNQMIKAKVKTILECVSS